MHKNVLIYIECYIKTSCILIGELYNSQLMRAIFEAEPLRAFNIIDAQSGSTPEMLAKSKIAIITQGQGGQHIGMGQRLADRLTGSQAARKIWEMAGDLLGGSFIHLCWNGPEEELSRTENAQPAIIVDALARKAVLDEMGIGETATIYTGNSLGFIAAAAMAGAISPEDAVKLARSRGVITQKGYDRKHTSMVAFIVKSEKSRRLQDPKIAETLRTEFGGELCLDNSDDQQVWGFDEDKINETIRYLNSEGINEGIVRLKITGAFHCSKQAENVPPFQEVLDAAEIKDPDRDKSLYAITRVVVLQTAKEVRQELLDQLTHFVRWRELMDHFRNQGVETLIELGETSRYINMLRKFRGIRERIELPFSGTEAKILTIAHLLRPQPAS